MFRALLDVQWDQPTDLMVVLLHWLDSFFLVQVFVCPIFVVFAFWLELCEGTENHATHFFRKENKKRECENGQQELVDGALIFMQRGDQRHIRLANVLFWCCRTKTHAYCPLKTIVRI